MKYIFSVSYINILIRISIVTIFCLFPAMSSSQDKREGIEKQQTGQLKEDNQLLRNSWTNGWYLLTGIGPTGGFIMSDDINARTSGGMHLSSAVGYYSMNAYGIEIGSIVSINAYNGLPIPNDTDTGINSDVVVWDTAFYGGLRVRVPGITSTNNINPHLRLLVGYGQSVGFIIDVQDNNYSYLKNVRIHNEGPLFGFSFGNFFATQDSSPVWFLEFTYIVQIHWFTYTVRKTAEDLPVITESDYQIKNSRITRGNISIGIRLF